MKNEFKNYGIARYGRYISLAILILSLAVGIFFSNIIVKAEAPDLIDQIFEKAGIPAGGFFTFGFEKITDCMKMMDEAMQTSLGVNTSFEDLVNDTKDEVVNAFKDIDNEEDAWEMLEKYLANAK